MRSILQATVVLACCSAGLTVEVPAASAAGVTVESYPNWPSFVASPLYDYISYQMVGGAPANAGAHVLWVLQGLDDVPNSSAGEPGNTMVTPLIEEAACGPPTVLALSEDPAAYEEQFVTLGNARSGSLPCLEFEMPPMPTTFSAGYLGYEIAIFDLGKNLVAGSGNKNTERSTFRVQQAGETEWHTVAGITNTGGDLINVILLDLDGLPGAPASIDRLMIEDASGTNPPQKGSLDIDGVLRLTADPAVPTLTTTWGRVRAAYR